LSYSYPGHTQSGLSKHSLEFLAVISLVLPVNNSFASGFIAGNKDQKKTDAGGAFFKNDH